MRLRTKHLLIALLVFVIEILVATVFADVRFIRSFLSDFLVVILLYHLIKAFRDDEPLALAVAVFAFSCLVEATQYYHLSDALGLRRDSLLSVLMGTSFSWIDIIMYFLGCCTSYIFDSRILSKTTPRIPLQ